MGCTPCRSRSKPGSNEPMWIAPKTQKEILTQFTSLLPVEATKRAVEKHLRDKIEDQKTLSKHVSDSELKPGALAGFADLVQSKMRYRTPQPNPQGRASTPDPNNKDRSRTPRVQRTKYRKSVIEKNPPSLLDDESKDEETALPGLEQSPPSIKINEAVDSETPQPTEESIITPLSGEQGRHGLKQDTLLAQAPKLIEMVNPHLPRSNSYTQFLMDRQGLVAHPFYDKFEILGDVISKDIICEVRRCRNLWTKEKYIVKIVSKEDQYIDTEIVRKEIAKIRALDHPNLLKLYDVYKYLHRYYVVYEFCKAKSLLESLENIEEKYNEYSVGKIILQVLDLLKYMKSQKVIHANINPHSILLIDADTLEIKISDMGLQFFTTQRGSALSMETVSFQSPEIFRGAFDTRTDVWSCGVLMYLLLTGEPPFKGRSAKEVQNNILKEEKDFKEDQNLIDISDSGVKLIAQMLQKSMVNRISVADIEYSTWAKQLARTDVEYFDEEPIDYAVEKLQLYHAHFNIKHSIRNFIVMQIETNKRSKVLKSRFKCVDRKKNNGKKTGLFNDRMLYDIYKFQLEEKEIRDEVDPILQNLEKDEQGWFEYYDFLEELVEQTIDKAKEYLETTFEDYEQAWDVKMAVEELEEMIGTSDIKQEREWADIVLKMKKKSNAEIKLDKLKDLFADL